MAFPKGRGSYRKITSMPTWGVFNQGSLIGTCKAADELHAQQVFLIHNQNQPDWAIIGDELKIIS